MRKRGCIHVFSQNDIPDQQPAVIRILLPPGCIIKRLFHAPVSHGSVCSGIAIEVPVQCVGHALGSVSADPVHVHEIEDPHIEDLIRCAYAKLGKYFRNIIDITSTKRPGSDICFFLMVIGFHFDSP